MISNKTKLSTRAANALRQYFGAKTEVEQFKGHVKLMFRSGAIDSLNRCGKTTREELRKWAGVK